MLEAERAAARSPVPPTGWRYSYGYRISLLGEDGRRTVLDAPDYPSAVRVRDEHMRTGSYWCAWVELRNE